MSSSVLTHWVNQFSANVFHLSQQKASRLRAHAISETLNAEFKYFDIYGTTDVMKKVGRHIDTTYESVPTSRRRLSMEDYFRSELVDQEDKLRMLHDPESQYTKSFMMAFGRQMDKIILEALLADVWEKDEDQVESSIALPDTQKLVSTKGTSFDRLSVDTLRRIKKNFMKNEVEGGINLVCDSEQIESLLFDEQIINADYNSVKALVNGDVNSFMGINFIRTELVASDNTSIAFNSSNGTLFNTDDATGADSYRKCIAFTDDACLLGVGQDLSARVDPLPTKHYANQVYAKMSMGAVRREDAKVMEVICKAEA